MAYLGREHEEAAAGVGPSLLSHCGPPPSPSWRSQLCCTCQNTARTFLGPNHTALTDTDQRRQSPDYSTLLLRFQDRPSPIQHFQLPKRRGVRGVTHSSNKTQQRVCCRQSASFCAVWINLSAERCTYSVTAFIELLLQFTIFVNKYCPIFHALSSLLHL